SPPRRSSDLGAATRCRRERTRARLPRLQGTPPARRALPALQALPARRPSPRSCPCRRRRRLRPRPPQPRTRPTCRSGGRGAASCPTNGGGTPPKFPSTRTKGGSTISGLMDSFATSISIALQYGVPLQTLVDKFTHTRFEPSGFTKNPEIPIAKSITDYIFRWLASKFLSREGKEAAGVILREPAPETAAAAGGDTPQQTTMPLGGGARPEPHGQAVPAAQPAPPAHLAQVRPVYLYQQDAPSCHECGAIMV